MNSKDEYVRLMQARMDRWNTEVDLLAAKAKVAAADLRIEYGEQIEHLAAKQVVARQKLDELKVSGSGAWEDLKVGIESAWKSMGEALTSARARFK